jgi:perosamine synthetase
MIPVSEPLLGKEEMENVIKAVKSTWISSKGEFIPQFEERFANYCNKKYGISTSSGTAALHLALSSLGIKRGDEVIVPVLTFIATANAVTYCNAKPIFVDSDFETWNIDPEKIEEKITNKTKAIIPVHLYGNPCDMKPILDIAKDHDLFIIEDAAEAHGAEYNGKKVGSFGDIGCFSFYGNKLITTGEGGMCITDNEELSVKMKILKDHGMDPSRKYWHNFIGFNYRMTNIQAAIGLAQLKKLDNFIKIKRSNAMLYNSLLKNIDGIKLPPETKNAKNIYWLYSVLIGHKFDVIKDNLIDKLKENGIETRPFFPPLNIQPPYINQVKENFPVAEELFKMGINLPSAVSIKKDEIKFVVDTVLSLID